MKNRIMPEIYCEFCGSKMAIRTSKKIHPQYKRNYLRCTGSDCDAGYVIDEFVETVTTEKMAEGLGVYDFDIHHSALLIVGYGDCDPAGDQAEVSNGDSEEWISRLLAVWRRLDLPIVHARMMPREHAMNVEPPSPQMELVSDSKEVVFDVFYPDAFLNTGLDCWLDSRLVKTVLVCGGRSEKHVAATATTASNLEYSAWVPEPACFTYGKTGVLEGWWPADEVQAMSMANLNDGVARVMDDFWLRTALTIWGDKAL